LFLRVKEATRLAILASCVGLRLVAADLCVKVVDATNSPIPRATLTATGVSEGGQYHAQTDSAGEACISKMIGGLYSVETSATGFVSVRYFPVRVSFPDTTRLSFRLPLGEITEGGMFGDATVVGTLRYGSSVMDGATLCAIDAKQNRRCTKTNDLGEYMLSLAPGSYQIEVSTKSGEIFRLKIDAAAPDVYRDAITLRDEDRRKQ
jgi:hypothetical protein